MTPQLIMIRPIHTEGVKYFIAKLLGASKMTYGTKKTATAMLYLLPVRSSSLAMLLAGVSLLSVRAFPRFTYNFYQPFTLPYQRNLLTRSR